MPALQNDPDIREGLFGLEEKLTIQQVRFVGERLRDLIVRYENASRDERLQPIEWKEWSAFIDAAYSCGFVCHDGGEDMGDRKKNAGAGVHAKARVSPRSGRYSLAPTPSRTSRRIDLAMNRADRRGSM